MESNTTGKIYLNICAKTFNYDVQGLFDYEGKEFKNFNAVIGNSIYLTRKNNEIIVRKDLNEINPEEEILFKVRYETRLNKYYLENEILTNIKPNQKNINNLQNKIWYIIRSDFYQSNYKEEIININNDDYYLSENDIIKFGRIPYYISEINVPKVEKKINLDSYLTNMNNYDISDLNKNTDPVFDFLFEGKGSNDLVEKDEEDQKNCKICYLEETDKKNDPFVHLCKCKGGLSFAHFNCIKEWMKSKMQMYLNENKNVKTYYVKGFNCEICKVPYPFRFHLPGIEKPFELLDIQKPSSGHYIILESLNTMIENFNYKEVHVIQLNDFELIVGRGDNSDIKINDISISEKHALLKFDKYDGSLLLRDLRSRLGTLVLVRKPLEIQKKIIQLQIGRTFVEGNLMTSQEFEELKNKTICLDKPKTIKKNKKK